MQTVDLVVVGLGAIGSAVVCQAAARRMNVIGVDQFIPPHTLGSTHGQTRITRLAIGEGAEYVPLVRRSHEIWKSLEHRTGRRLLTQCGGLIIGWPDRVNAQHGVDNFLARTLAAADEYHIDSRRLDFDQLRQEFPQFRYRGDEEGYYEFEAGYVSPESCLLSQIESAVSDGADIRFQTPVTDIRPDGDDLIVQAGIHQLKARHVVVSSGAWVHQFLPEPVDKHFTVYRQNQFWFRPRSNPEHFEAGSLPVFIWVGENESDLIYGFPPTHPGGGVKVASEAFEQTTTPETRMVEVSPAEIEAMRHRLQQRMPDLPGECVRASSCLYTCTPDFRFVVDVHPEWRRCLLVSPCSGHGFKHSAAIGEAVADWLESGDRPQVLEPFRMPADS